MLDSTSTDAEDEVSDVSVTQAVTIMAGSDVWAAEPSDCGMLIRRIFWIRG